MHLQNVNHRKCGGDDYRVPRVVTLKKMHDYLTPTADCLSADPQTSPHEKLTVDNLFGAYRTVFV